MTKKEEILAFVEQYVNEELSLQFESIMTQSNETCFMFVGARKERIITILSENFSDNLLGNMPNDTTQHQIISWSVALRA